MYDAIIPKNGSVKDGIFVHVIKMKIYCFKFSFLLQSYHFLENSLSKENDHIFYKPVQRPIYKYLWEGTRWLAGAGKLYTHALVIAYILWLNCWWEGDEEIDLP